MVGEQLPVGFYVSSGLKVNFSKSKVYGIGVPNHEVVNWANPLGYESASFPFTYLGVPMGMDMNCMTSWSKIVDKLRTKLSAWKEKKLLVLVDELHLLKLSLGVYPLIIYPFLVPQLES